MSLHYLIIIFILYFIIRPYCLRNISKLVDECRRYSKPKQCCFRAWLKRPNFRGYVSQGNAETLVRRDGITNHHSIAYSLSNISAKIYQNRLMCIEFTVYNVNVVFLRQCRKLRCCWLKEHMPIVMGYRSGTLFCWKYQCVLSANTSPLPSLFLHPSVAAAYSGCSCCCATTWFGSRELVVTVHQRWQTTTPCEQTADELLAAAFPVVYPQLDEAVHWVEPVQVDARW